MAHLARDCASAATHALLQLHGPHSPSWAQRLYFCKSRQPTGERAQRLPPYHHYTSISSITVPLRHSAHETKGRTLHYCTSPCFVFKGCEARFGAQYARNGTAHRDFATASACKLVCLMSGPGQPVRHRLGAKRPRWKVRMPSITVSRSPLNLRRAIYGIIIRGMLTGVDHLPQRSRTYYRLLR